MSKYKVLDEYGKEISSKGVVISFNTKEEAIQWLLDNGYKPGHIEILVIVKA